MINMAGILLTAANKGFWKANPETIRELANTLGTMVVRYGPSCSANVCGNKDTIAFSKVWMNPELARAYTRAMTAALAGSGYAGANAVGRGASSLSSGSSVGHASARKPLFDFSVDHLPVSVHDVFRTLRNQDWDIIFAYLLLALIPSGLTVFFLRDRYHRRGRDESIELGL
jgi:hypothetical protein